MSVYPHCSEEIMIAAARVGMSLAQYATDTPERVAIHSPWGARSWHELNVRANQLVRAIRTAGLDDGDSVGIV